MSRKPGRSHERRPKPADALAELAACRDEIEVDRSRDHRAARAPTDARQANRRSQEACAGLPILDPTREAAVIRRVTTVARETRSSVRARSRSVLADHRHVASDPAGRTLRSRRGTRRMTTFECVAIIGLGLIGGSIARDLAALGVRSARVRRRRSTPRRGAVRTKIVTTALDAIARRSSRRRRRDHRDSGRRAIDVLRRIAPHVRRAKLDHRRRQHEDAHRRRGE